jgi:integrase
MPAKPQVRYFDSRHGYYCQWNHKQYLLAKGPDDAPTGPTYLDALGKFQEIMQLGAVNEAGGENSIRVVLETYIQHISTKKSPGTVEIRLRAYKPFVDFLPNTGGGVYGERTVSTLTHNQVYAFLAAMEKPAKRGRDQKNRRPVHWGLGSQRNCLQSLNAAFNWAARSGLIPKNPLVGIEMPAASSRGEDALIGNNVDEIDANHRKIIGYSKPWLKPFIQALKDTGARPGEIAAATAENFDPEAAAFVFRKASRMRSDRFKHKNASKGKERVIFLTGETLVTVRELVAKFPTGPLFRRKVNRGFHKTCIVMAFQKLQRKMKMPMLTAYSYRHTFATEMLKAGMDVETLAELMGNSAAVIRLHYSHLLADKPALRGKLERFKTLAAGTRTQSAPASADGALA